MMDFKLLMNFCSDLLSPSVLFGMAGVATISIVGGLDLFFTHTARFMQLERKQRRVPRMKGVVIRSYGGLGSVEVRTDLPIPKIMNGDEILIQVIAAGLDNMDLMVTRGYGKAIRSHLRQHNEHVEDESIILGRECSGIVLKVGKEVTYISKGDEVWAVSPYCYEGLMAEYVVVKENQVALKPKNLTFEEAASLPYTAIQVCNALLNQARLNSKSTKGKRILLLTGNSPVGLFTMQLLKAWGGDITTAVPTTGLPMCHELGADDVIVYTVTNFETELKKRRRFDIILNAAGTILHQLCVDISSPGGKVITFTTTPILSDKFDVMLGSCLAVVLQVMAWIKKLKQGMLTNFWWDNFSYDREYLVKTAAFVEEGKISPIIETVYDIDDAAFAFQQLGRFDNVGKNVLRIS
ncbi:reticulon-4-interacting protein 1 homolog, mitochondrial-like isoform X1 [Argiope bruennichi]|uniref:reticulon-4-interacting protein 1 homolog, mitochondrial-like isoform X1 n=1 Tax=Argiope bruennichi TaxID=94029 RepID=UPI002494504E|nr:reticulon-4-interacting protein 1 homolog, mitochondrial-like isoform X1 [Argiope bruennichi]